VLKVVRRSQHEERDGDGEDGIAEGDEAATRGRNIEAVPPTLV
jgi:hypothetical protein